MSLFSQSSGSSNAQHRQQVKAWAGAALNLDPAVPISISQLRCTEPGCPPLETAIAILTTPPVTYKIHKALDELTEADVTTAIAAGEVA
jgi:hypothetical protein